MGFMGPWDGKFHTNTSGAAVPPLAMDAYKVVVAAPWDLAATITILEATTTPWASPTLFTRPTRQSTP